MRSGPVTRFTLLVGLVAMAAGAQASEPRRPDPGAGTRHACVFAKVADGDTLTCRGGPKVRLLLIDAPEMAQPHWGARARDGFVLALTYPPNVNYVERIRLGIEDAKAHRRGLWATGAFACSPREFRQGRCR